MRMKTTLTAHLRAALAAAVVLGLCQVVIGTIVIAAWTRSFLLGPYSIVGTQTYDFCVKVAAVLPVTAGWLHGGPLDRFVAEGFLSKLTLGRAMLTPNLLVLVVLGFFVGTLRFLFARPARLVPVVLTLAAFGLVVHCITFAKTVYYPGSIWLLVRNTAYLALGEGMDVAVIVLALATLAAVLVARLARTAHLVALGALAAVAVVMLAASSPPSQASSTTRGYEPPPRTERNPQVDNVLLISIDSLRADRLGCYGNGHDTSPTIDQVARNGIRFANALSTTSWTLPSHLSMLTGRYLLSHGVILQKERLPEDVPTLAEALRQGGLATAAVVSGIFLDHEFGFDRGFDYYDDRVATGAFRPDAPNEPAPPIITDLNPLTWQPGAAAEYLRRFESAPVVTDLTLRWLRAHHEKRFLLFVHFFDVHHDYVPPPPFDKMFDPDYKGSITGVDFYINPAVRKGMPERDIQHLLALYDGEIRWVDGHIARILAELADLRIADRTAVIITADHGDEFFEHGGKGHGRTLYREVMHVPLVMHIPGESAGTVMKNPVSLVDLAPTILDLAGVAGSYGMDGISLMPTIRQGEAPTPDPVGAFFCDLRHQTHCQAMQSSDAGTMIYRFQPMRIEFYRLSDPLEERNIATSSDWPRQQELSRLVSSLNSTWQTHLRLGTRGTVQFDKATQERLRALGYAE